MEQVKEYTLTFEEIYEEYYSRIYRYVSIRVGNPSDREDITSKIFIKVYENYESYRPSKGSMTTWIFTIAANTLKDYYRKKKIRNFFSLDREVEDDRDMEGDVILREDLKHLRKKVDKLPERERQLISLKYGGELSHDEIGEILGITSNYVGVLHHRILEKLREEMEGYHDESYGKDAL